MNRHLTILSIPKVTIKALQSKVEEGIIYKMNNLIYT